MSGGGEFCLLILQLKSRRLKERGGNKSANERAPGVFNKLINFLGASSDTTKGYINARYKISP